MNFPDVADRPIFDQLHCTAELAMSRAWAPVARRQLCFYGQSSQLARFRDIQAERPLAADWLAGAQCTAASNRMKMIVLRHHQRVEGIVSLVE
jgi:hypothetical protein